MLVEGDEVVEGGSRLPETANDEAREAREGNDVETLLEGRKSSHVGTSWSGAVAKEERTRLVRMCKSRGIESWLRRSGALSLTDGRAFNS